MTQTANSLEAAAVAKTIQTRLNIVDQVTNRNLECYNHGSQAPRHTLRDHNTMYQQRYNSGQ